MAGRSIVNQGLYLKKETTAGTANTTGMNRFLGMGLRPGWNVEREDYRGEGFKVPTSSVVHMASGQHTVNTLQDYNALTPVLASVLSYDGATQPDAENAEDAYEHTFHLEADAADDMTSFTAIWGDSTQALQMVWLVFNSLTFGVQRRQLTINTSAISEAPTTGASIPSSGIVEIPSIPIAGRTYDVYADDSWTALGTTQLDACYDLSWTIGDKYTTDTPIDSSISSFASLVENADINFTGSMRLGFDSEATSAYSDYTDGSQKFFRLESTGTTIGGTTKYGITVDVSAIITDPGEIGEAPNSPVVTLPFNLRMNPDTTSGNTLTVTLTNTVAAL